MRWNDLYPQKLYNLNSKGTGERFNYTIKKYLGKDYIHNLHKKLDFDCVRIMITDF